MRFHCVAVALALATTSHPALAGTLIVLQKSAATAVLLDVASGEALATLPTGAGPHEVDVSPDGRTAVIANYEQSSSLTVIDVERREVVKTIDLGPYRRPHGVRYLPDGNRVLVTAEKSRALLVVDVPLGRVTHAIETHADLSHMVATTPDGRRAFVANMRSGSVSVIDLAARRVVATIQTGAGAEGIDVSPDGREVWVTNRAADTVSVIDVSSLSVVGVLESSSSPIRVEFTPDGGHALVSNWKSDDVTVFDARRRVEVHRIELGTGHAPIGILVAPAGKQAYVASTGADLVSIVDPVTWKVSGSLRSGPTPDGMAYSPR